MGPQYPSYNYSTLTARLSYNHRQKCWEGYQFLPFWYLSPPAPGSMLDKTKLFLCVIVVTCPNIE